MKTEKLTIRKMTTEDLFPLYHVLSDSEAVEDARKVFIGYLQTVTLKEKENEDGKIRTDSKWRFL